LSSCRFGRKIDFVFLFLLLPRGHARPICRAMEWDLIFLFQKKPRRSGIWPITPRAPGRGEDWAVERLPATPPFGLLSPQGKVAPNAGNPQPRGLRGVGHRAVLRKPARAPESGFEKGRRLDYARAGGKSSHPTSRLAVCGDEAKANPGSWSPGRVVFGLVRQGPGGRRAKSLEKS